VRVEVPGKPRRIEIDFVRGIAILMVMLYHFPTPRTGIALLDSVTWAFGTAGLHGVDLFFVLSGFLVGGLLLKEYEDTTTVKPAKFLIRRAIKIWPAFYVLILFHVVVHRHPFTTFFWQNVFQVQNYLGTSVTQTWTLSIEEHFYLFLAILLGFAASRKWAPRKILKLLIVVSAASFTARCVTAYMGNLSGATRWTQNRIDSLLFGVIIALLFHCMPEVYARITRRCWPLVLLTLAGIVFALLVPEGPLFMGPGYALLYVSGGAFMLLVMEYSGKLAGLWAFRVIAKIGVYSYAIYLWHSLMLQPGEMIIARFSAIPAWFVALGVEFAGSLFLGYVMTRFVEWPALYLRESIPWLQDSKPLIAEKTIPEQPGRAMHNVPA